MYTDASQNGKTIFYKRQPSKGAASNAFSQNNIPYKLKTKSSSPLHVMDSAVLGSMKQPLELIHTFLVPEKDADRARMLLQHIQDKL